MALLLDTNVAIHLRDADEPFVSRVAERTLPLAISMITLVELEAGLRVAPAPLRNRRRGYDDLLGHVRIIDLNRAIVSSYGDILEAAGFSRTRIFDRLIAATALVYDLTLVTINAADFSDIPGLKLEVWPAPGQ